MPKSKRDFLKRYMAHSYSNLGRAAGHLIEVEDHFRGTHDDYADFLALMITTIAETRGWVAQFCKHAWNIDQETIETWRNLRKR